MNCCRILSSTLSKAGARGSISKNLISPTFGKWNRRLLSKDWLNHTSCSATKVDKDELLALAKTAAEAGATIVMENADKPKDISFKGLTDLVTTTDETSEKAILDTIQRAFPDHAILGEEGGVFGNTSSDYLWCVDPLDGTTNFAHGYPSFAVSVAVLRHAIVLASCVIEFVGGPGMWNTRTFTASRNGGAFANGKPIEISRVKDVEKSLLVTGFGYEHDDAWSTNMECFKHFTDISQGVRRFGAAAVDLCHVAMGISEAYWEYRLKPWDTAAGVLMVEEAGGLVTTMDGLAFSPFDRSVLASNGFVHKALLEYIEPATAKLLDDGVDLSPWYIPKGYRIHLGAQLEN
eukprot:g5026.t1